MTRRRVAGLVVGLVLAAGGLGACGDDGADPTAFCRGVTGLRDDDPFEDLPLASPAEMRDAFAALDAAATSIARVAPDQAEVQADRYAASVDALVDELSAAGFDPRRVDPTRYRGAVADYTEAAVSLDNAADAAC